MITRVSQQELRLSYVRSHATFHRDEHLRRYAKVPSTSQKGTEYRVDIIESPTGLASARCTCPSYTSCVHRQAIDVILRDQTPTFRSDTEFLYTVIRDGKFVEVTEAELTETERRMMYETLFSPNF